MTIAELRSELRALADARQASILMRFFKTGPGKYGEGDRFLGIKVPVLRKLAQQYRALSIDDAVRLLRSEFHEERLTALFILIFHAVKGDEPIKKQIYDLYLANVQYVNNWDLVDLSSRDMVGRHLEDKSRAPLMRLAKSKNLWERRIAIVATYHFIRQHDFADTLAIAQTLLADREDLIHKAVGWMLREVGKHDIAVLEGFLDFHGRHMPRTMLRYAIERFPEKKRLAYLNQTKAANHQLSVITSK